MSDFNIKTNKLVEKMSRFKVIPVIAMDDAEDAVLLAKVLVENGLPCAEVTFRTPAAFEVMTQMRAAYPDLLIGAGTVLTTDQVDLAILAGVDFIVSPGLNPEVVRYCQQKSIPIIPGINSPSQVEQGLALGLDALKFFPAEASGGIAMLKALMAVYPVSFMPTGGVSERNVSEYLALDYVFCCGGTWMVPAKLITNKQWDDLADLIKTIRV
jgi:2-dehydro-3-deoxyphosphogluconate aldolase/(4S)-4-hydroxy-2-oxoglutarate aldolase